MFILRRKQALGHTGALCGSRCKPASPDNAADNHFNLNEGTVGDNNESFQKAIVS